MAPTDPDPFASGDGIDEGVPRDGRGRPRIVPLVRNKPKPDGKLISYTRASTFAKALDDGAGLTRWKIRHAVLGVAVSPDLAALAAAMGRNLNALTDGDKRNLDGIAERAHDRSGGNEKADYGTAVHSMTEPGRDPFAVDPAMQRDANAYAALLDALDVDVVDTEVFVVNDPLKVAGTFDHTWRLRTAWTINDGASGITIPAGTIVVVDKKTGRLSLGAHAIQLATYARASRYPDPATGERVAMDASPEWGVVAHIPKGTGTAAAYLIDLTAGWKGAKLAQEVRAYRSTERSLGQLVARVEAPEVAETVAVEGTVDPAEVIEPPAPPTVEAVQDIVDGEVIETPGRKAALMREPSPEPAPVPAGPSRVAPVGVDAFGDPLPDPTLTEADAIANLHRAGLEPQDVVMRDIGEAITNEECRALWSKYARLNLWRDEHTAAVKTRLGELAAA